MNIPWRAETERRLRQKLLLAWAAGFLSFAGFITLLLLGAVLDHWFLLGAGLFFVVAAISLGFRMRLGERLGWEEQIVQGVRFPGNGMLANKPRDTSRLTRWIRLNSDVLNHSGWLYRCDNCGRIFGWQDFGWIANVEQCDEKLGDVPAIAIDPGGGRYVLICKCGRGYYMLKETFHERETDQKA